MGRRIGNGLEFPAMSGTAIPGTPAAGFLRLYSELVAGRAVIAVKDENGLFAGLQTTFARNKMGLWMPNSNAAAVPIATGIQAPSTTGTATARGQASTNLFTSVRRLGVVSAATAPSLAEIRQGQTGWWRGNAAGLGGFAMAFTFGTSDPANVSGARMFCGLTATTAAATNVSPDTLVDCVGVCQLSASTNLQVMHNDSAGTATVVDLGASYPANTQSADLYQCCFFCPPNGSTIGYQIARLGTSNVATGTLSTNLPTAATFLGIRMWRSNNATAAAVALDLVNFYIETDN